MNEFSWIARYFAPLAAGIEGSLQLLDDAALLDVPAGKQLIITKDAMAAGVHFLGTESPDMLARKLLRVNLSDLAAKGATPHGYLLALMLPEGTAKSFVAAFAQGLAHDQASYGTHLLGGDTISTKGPLAFSLTALGHVPQGQALLRSGAKSGDDIYVSGWLGDSALGLASVQGKLPVLDANHKAYLQERYFLPQPRVALGQKLIGLASASMDISDGLLQDLGHICKASQVGAKIQRHLLPLSAAARVHGEAAYDAALAGGDDYELLFTASAAHETELAELAQALALPLTKVGSITAGEGVALLDKNFRKTPFESKGFQHF